MNEQEFVVKMVEIMDTEERLTMDSILNDIYEWDSLALVAFLAMCRAFDCNVTSKDVKAARSIHDLYVLFKGEK